MRFNMAPKSKVTKEMILQTGYLLVQQDGIESVNSRNIAQILCCSTQPIFSHFPTMEELRQSVHDYVCEVFEKDVLLEADRDHFMQNSYLKFIQLARNEKNLFTLLFLSKYCKLTNFTFDKMQYTSYQKMLLELKEKYGLNDEACLSILTRITFMLQGIGTLMVTSNLSYSNKEVIDLIETTLLDMVKGFSTSLNA